MKRDSGSRDQAQSGFGRRQEESTLTNEELAEYRRYLGNPQLTPEDVEMLKDLNL